jgi:hypothetical protein
MFKSLVFGCFLLSFQLTAQDVGYMDVGKVTPELESYKRGKEQLDSIDGLRRLILDSVYDVPWRCRGNSSKEFIAKWYEDHQEDYARWDKRDEELDSLSTVCLQISNEEIQNELKELSAQFCSEKQIGFLVTEEVYYGIKPEDVTEEFIRFICPSDR